MALIFYLSSIPSLRSSFDWDYLYRKLAHCGEYAVLSFLYYRALDRGANRDAVGWPAWSLGVLYAATDEFHQTFVPGRAGELSDVLLDSLGCLAGIFLYRMKHSMIETVARSKKEG